MFVRLRPSGAASTSAWSRSAARHGSRTASTRSSPHESRHDFVVSCLVNPTTRGTRADDRRRYPTASASCTRTANLGLGGRTAPAPRADGRRAYFVWVQDDMRPSRAGSTPSSTPRTRTRASAASARVRVDETARCSSTTAGWRRLPTTWPAGTPPTTTTTTCPTEVTVLDWVTSKGCLTRTAAFDEVGGPDPRLWPLNPCDLDFCTHLRCHGWDVALVPSARVRHGSSLSAPGALRDVPARLARRLVRRQVGGLRRRPGRSLQRSRRPPLPGLARRGVDPVEAAGPEATRMLVPFARVRSRAEAEAAALAGRGRRSCRPTSPSTARSCGAHRAGGCADRAARAERRVPPGATPAAPTLARSRSRLAGGELVVVAGDRAAASPPPAP